MLAVSRIYSDYKLLLLLSVFAAKGRRPCLQRLSECLREGRPLGGGFEALADAAEGWDCRLCDGFLEIKGLSLPIQKGSSWGAKPPTFSGSDSYEGRQSGQLRCSGGLGLLTWSLNRTEVTCAPPT